jgi:hypothetical protein
MARLGLITAILIILAVKVQAQSAGFFSGGTVGYDPEISILNVGTLLDARATVDVDRKYVTITARPQSSALIGMQTFTFVRSVNQGTVGSTAGASILDQRGMTLIAPLPIQPKK